MATSTAPQGLPVIRAAGGIVLRSTPRGNEVMVVFRKHHHDWTLPKGKLKEGESFQEAALREVEEETGCSCDLGSYAGTISYAHDGVPKVVMFWKMSVLEEKILGDNDEISEAAWLSVSDALQRLTHTQEKSLLSRLGAGKSAPAPPAEIEPEPQSVQPGSAQPGSASRQELSPALPSAIRPSSRSGKRRGAQLVRDMHAFKIELAYLENRNAQDHAVWAVAAREHLDRADLALKENDLEEARRDFQRACRYAIQGMNQEELVARAQVLREEAAKNASWRTVAMKRLLGVSDDKLTAARVADAMGLRDDDAVDQSAANRRVLDYIQALVLACILGAALVFMTLTIGWISEFSSAILVAMIGAAIASAQVLSRRPANVLNLASMLLTIALSSLAGLAAAPLCADVITTFKLRPQPAWLAEAGAFLLGYAAQRLLIRFAVEPRDPANR